ncbi:Uncharacterized protein FWK35_00018209 [Aphis craccivora]|uniref:Uncharacterized protein n=1 Tax=Aphis craccivora TaxID=307492 RepID=A0A6G0ZH92_APHCR|nr:Uncharacterized protein FWK35_00018209 [Aphis craccivora]
MGFADEGFTSRDDDYSFHIVRTTACSAARLSRVTPITRAYIKTIARLQFIIIIIIIIIIFRRVIDRFGLYHCDRAASSSSCFFIFYGRLCSRIHDTRGAGYIIYPTQ